MLNRNALVGLLAWIMASQSWGLTGQSADYMTLVDVDTDVVRSWLPEKLTIDNDGPTHKVMMNFGRQRGVGGLPPYVEMSVKVPGVRFRDQTNNPDRYQYYKILYMNNRQAVNWGIILYDSPKKYADASMDDEGVTFYDQRSGEVIYQATVQKGAAESVPTSHPNVQEFYAALDMPRITYRKGRYRCWDTERRSEVQLVPYEVDVSVKPGFIDGWSGTDASLGSIDQESFGAFMEISSWRFFEVDC